MSDSRYNVIVIGGGIVGLAVALEITRRFPHLRLLMLKARLCVAGAAAMIEFCREHGIAHKVCGKVVVATRSDELPRLEQLRQRGEANGLVGLRLIGAEELREIEPHAAALQALLVPSTGVTDYVAVCQKYAELISNAGGAILTSALVTDLKRLADEIIVETSRGAFSTTSLINCAGLFSDRISRLAGDDPQVMIVPFRGEYYELIPERAALVRALIYPVPDPRFPFLGVHFTRRVSGKVDAGPNAVLALRREGYRHSDVSLRDLASSLTFPGFWRMAAQHWRSGLDEFHRSLSKSAFVRALQKLLPEVREKDLVPGGSGVRAQALKRDGAMVDDFQFVHSGKILHVLNVPSPAATASLMIGRTIVDTARVSCDWVKRC